jgi:nucleotide-binding universal stress UspA family protein
MYKTILMPLDGTSTDRTIIEHIKQLAAVLSSRVVLFHVATSAAAQWHGSDAGGEAIEESQAYLDKIKVEFEAAGVPAEAELAYGDPVREIVKWVEENGCDLVAMATHGHRAFADLVLGTTASPVQHSVDVPVLLLRAK